jgi:hypothetical protein
MAALLPPPCNSCFLSNIASSSAGCKFSGNLNFSLKLSVLNLLKMNLKKRKNGLQVLILYGNQEVLKKNLNYRKICKRCGADISLSSSGTITPSPCLKPKAFCRTGGGEIDPSPAGFLKLTELDAMLERKQELQGGGKRAAIRSWKYMYTAIFGQVMAFFKDKEGNILLEFYSYFNNISIS